VGFPHDALIFKIKKALDELEREKVDGLEGAILEIMNLKESELYEKVYHAAALGRSVNEPNSGFLERLFNKDRLLKRIYGEKVQNSRLLKLGYENLSKSPNLPPITGLISYFMMCEIYKLFDYIYYINVERKLGRHDVENIFLSRIDERVIFFLDNFDKILDTPEPTSEFFIQLKRIKWKNKETKKFFNKLNYIKSLVREDRFGHLSLLKNERSEDNIIQFLSGCSAVNRRQNKINQEDVIRAYKTYFKLIKTDITKYKAKPELNTNDIERTDNGFLVCEKCNGYYKLHEGEYPEDFDKCQCGGKLKYYEDISEFENTKPGD